MISLVKPWESSGKVRIFVVINLGRICLS